MSTEHRHVPEPGELVYQPRSSWAPAIFAFALALAVCGIFAEGFMVRGWIYSIIGGVIALFALRSMIKDATAGYRAFRAQTLLDIDYAATRAKGYGFQIELAYRVAKAGGKIVEIPITFTDRVRGYSKMSMAVMVEEMALVSWWGIRDRLKRTDRR